MASHSRNSDIDMDNDNNTDDKNDILVTPWEVQGDLEDKNYVKLMEKFGTQSLSQGIIDKIKKLTGEVHPLIKSQYFFSHRDLDWILNKYENGEPFYLYTGSGPSDFIHIGHILPRLFTKFMQHKFESKLLSQIPEDEKYLYDLGISEETCSNYTYEDI